MPGRIFLAIAGMAGAIAVAVDAAGSHLLSSDPERLSFASTAARYGLIHAVALLALALPERRGFWLDAAAWCFIAGQVFFCGSLDLLAAGAPHGFAAGVPWGGTAFILGWLAVLVAALRLRRG